MRVLLKFKSVNNLVLFTDATPSARHFSLPRLNNSFGGDFHLVFKLRLNPVTFVCNSRKERRIPLRTVAPPLEQFYFMTKLSNVVDSIIFVNNLSRIQAVVMHLFSFTDYHKWKHICILHFASSPTVHKWFCHTVPSGLPCAQVRSRTILIS